MNNTALIAILVLVGLGGFVAAAILLGVKIPGLSGGGGFGGAKASGFRGKGSGFGSGNQGNQKSGRQTGKDGEKLSVFEVESDSESSQATVLTIEKKLKFGRWRMNVLTFHLVEATISLVLFAVVHHYAGIPLQLVSLFSGPTLMRYLLNRAVDKRFKHFDGDYPAFLSQTVSLLKTGMNVTQALEAAANGLEDHSLVKSEITMMIERLRFGVAEEKSIGAFAEDVYHPEIELFVQALLLGRRVGGTLSDTLERLAKQVRRRQYFRESAQAAVSMQRGSVFFILIILIALQGYLLVVFPEAVLGPFKHEVGFQIWQGCIILILAAQYWISQVTKIKV